MASLTEKLAVKTVNLPAETFPNPVPISFSARLLYINPRIANMKDAQWSN